MHSTARDAEADLPAVEKIDRLAFEPIWRLSKDDLRYAAAKSSYCTVAERDGEIMGYTMSSSSGIYAHLARLAVHPHVQRQRLGFALVQNLLDHFINELNYWGVTLNTQSDNTSSLALYHKIGFTETGERFPVYIFPTDRQRLELHLQSIPGQVSMATQASDDHAGKKCLRGFCLISSRLLTAIAIKIPLRGVISTIIDLSPARGAGPGQRNAPCRAESQCEKITPTPQARGKASAAKPPA
jgi:ribosomal protein S18 acetylase RimI-like enzyme